MGNKKNVVFDFDGVIHSDVSGWQGAAVCEDPPVPGIRAELARIRAAGYRVYVVSSRCKYPEGIRAVEDYLLKWDIPVDGVCAVKPPARAYVDDRGLRFNGDPAGLLEQIEGFKPYWEA